MPHQKARKLLMIVKRQVIENDPVDGAPLVAEVEPFVHVGTGFQYTVEVLSLPAFPGV